MSDILKGKIIVHHNGVWIKFLQSTPKVPSRKPEMSSKDMFERKGKTPLSYDFKNDRNLAQAYVCDTQCSIVYLYLRRIRSETSESLDQYVEISAASPGKTLSCGNLIEACAEAYKIINPDVFEKLKFNGKSNLRCFKTDAGFIGHVEFLLGKIT